MRVHQLTFAVLAVAAGLSLTACQSDADGTDQSQASFAPSASSSSSAAGSSNSGQSGGNDAGGKNSTGPGTAAGTGSDKNGTAGRCRTDELAITAIDSTIDGDPDGTVAVQFKNHGGRDCTLSGYAGVDLKTSAGSLPAKRTGEKAGSMTLKNGKSVAFGINYPINKSGGSGVRITGLLVTPPNETETVSLAWPGAATLPVTDGSGSPVKVGPIGSAGQGG
ncbi:DUF4232 domain-containing protein [Streptomyces sp. H39-S7]|uniref:DUF4232 domain-containing protein n=1 Tax=Streptomyces sp. H39-S7 TaxID=3004357 RepID=UPI0022B04D31|nr:DUF4232 domain-containing protein [Streptomyces sp. H39-S7]MCZ4126070.1 DUF4232 domain-containing protein [Streptomyces sp. H39-S7]